MKTGMTIQDLALEVKRQQDAKRDYLMPTSAMRFVPDKGQVWLTGIDELGEAPVRPRAHAQFADLTKIPKKYYDRMMADSPELLCDNLNHWLHQGPKQRLVRTLDGQVRAVLSDRYRTLDNMDFVAAMVPALQRSGCEVRSCQLTEDRLYLKVVNPAMTELLLPPGAEMGKGHDAFDEISAGLVASNSEVGAGRIALQPAIHTTGCTNMAISRENTMARTHLGGILGGGDDVTRYMTDDTRRQSDLALWRQLADIAQAAVDGRIMRDQMDKLREARGMVIEGEVAPAVERVAAQIGLTQDESGMVLDELIRSGDLTQYGVHSAITRISQEDCVDYERATELEVLGHDVVTLPSTTFQAITGPSAAVAS